MNSETLRMALVGYMAEREKVNHKIEELQNRLGQGKSQQSAAVVSGGRKKLSASARASIAAAQRRRWKKYHLQLAEQQRLQEDTYRKRIAGLVRARRAKGRKALKAMSA
jgi:hypothetical protein